jgi:2-desacetyl-2-hydroxyethyl bacteriochlorophyllide A dehydrogenase
MCIGKGEQTMKAGRYYGGKDIRVEEVPDPKPRPGEALVQVLSAGICGSDLHSFRGEFGQPPERPVTIMGHEVVGQVVELGKDVQRVKPGDRVGLQPLIGCGECERCRSGMSYICYQGRTIGIHCDGGFAEYISIPQENCYILSDQVSTYAATLLDVYACALHGLTRVPISPGDRVVVIGTGALGIALAQLAVLAGAGEVVIVGRNNVSVQTAARLAGVSGISSQEQDPVNAVMEWSLGRGAEIVFEAVGGKAQTLSLALKITAHGGTVGVEGVHIEPQVIETIPALLREVGIVWLYSHGRRKDRAEFEIVLELIASGKLNADPLVTHHFTLDQIAEAFATADDHTSYSSVKVVIQP